MLKAGELIGGGLATLDFFIYMLFFMLIIIKAFGIALILMKSSLSSQRLLEQYREDVKKIKREKYVNYYMYFEVIKVSHNFFKNHGEKGLNSPIPMKWILDYQSKVLNNSLSYSYAKSELALVSHEAKHRYLTKYYAYYAHCLKTKSLDETNFIPKRSPFVDFREWFNEKGTRM
jgi:hypothetical protein